MKCFADGTMILTAAGLVAIENIKAGDRVISTNTDTFERAEKTVLETYIRETNEFVHLTINGELIQTTHEHPFYVKGTGFVNAEKLCIGDKLIDPNGTAIAIENIKFEATQMPVTVYNFQVADFHTYYVGNCGALVHNSNCIGENGTKTNSTTTWKNGETERIDVENGAPGKRDGNIHYHDSNNKKYYYDIKDKNFFDLKTGAIAPKQIQALLNNNSFLKGIKKGLKILGE